METESILNFSILNAGLYMLLIKFSLNLIFIFILSYLIYFRKRNNRTYLFTFAITNIIVFFVSGLLNDLSVSAGFAFGIFAIFSILRFRTMSIPVKEMAYLFISISIAIINSLFNNKISILELLFTNFAIVSITFLIEKYWVKNEKMKLVIYEKIDNIKPENYSLLLMDLRNRTGLDITRFEIGKIDFLKDSSEIKIYYIGNEFHFEYDGDEDKDDD